MAVTYEGVTPPLIENTIMQKMFINGVHNAYYIAPAEGYVIHDKMYDEEVIDDETHEPTGEIRLGYTGGTISVGANYDFVANPREVYAVLRSTVDENYIFGGGDDNDHEVM